MFDPHRQPKPIVFAAEPETSEFTIRLTVNETRAVHLLAARAEVTPQEVVDRLATLCPFRELAGLMSGTWTCVNPDTGEDEAADMTEHQEMWAEAVLFALSLLKGDALQRYLEDHTISDPPSGVQ